MAIENTEDIEILLAWGDLRLKTAPYGASLRGFWRETANGARRDIITSYTSVAGKVGGQGDVLIPFPGRVSDGRYTFEGKTHQMERKDKDGPNAIHGFFRSEIWKITEQSENAVTLAAEQGADKNPGYPFALRATVEYRLDDTGMTCRFAVENLGDEAAPVAAGFHPYFTVGSARIDADLLHVPMASTLEFDANLIPTGTILPVEGTGFDFREPRRVGSTAFNTCYSDPLRDPDGRLRILLSDPDTKESTTVWMDEAFGYVVLYSGDPLPDKHRRRALAIEPMTCGSDAFNHPEWGLAALAPGQVLTGSWGVHESQ
ncbi:MAG: aldose epimerase [Cytophagales bacterium]|nr:aldose epimerase [Armatimonadota bacterium]